MITELVAAIDSDAAIEKAVVYLAAGDVVALPTETVYGLAADASRADAVAKIFSAKGRPAFDPLIVHLPDKGYLPLVAAPDVITTETVTALIERYWPGPLTLVLPATNATAAAVRSGLPTIAVRMSAHPVFARVLARFGRPLAAPSANRFGRISPTTAAHVIAELDGRIPLVLDGGSCVHGVESTIVRVDGTKLVILRPGPIIAEELAEYGHVQEFRPGHSETSTALEPAAAPGMLESHYAPSTPLEPWRGRSPRADERVGLLVWNLAELEVCGGNLSSFAIVRELTPENDAREAAANLYAEMRALDEAGLDRIFFEEKSGTGLLKTILDRLTRASR